MQNSNENLLRVEELKIEFSSSKGPTRAVNDITFNVSKGETVCIVGESGSGKSITLLSIMKLLSKNGEITNGNIHFQGNNMRNLSNKQMRKIRNQEISMIFQDPMTALNPVFTIGYQITETILNHSGLSKKATHERVIELLTLVGIPAPKQRIKQYPHELSGGMRQRVMIAIALSNNPKLLIADEPTTALDVTIQSQILDLIQDLKEKFNMGVLFVTHDMSVVTEIADRILVMYGGKIVEEGTVEDVMVNPKHPYTEGLLNSVPDINRPDRPLEPIPGSPPSLDDDIPGCHFHPRCKYAMEECSIEYPSTFTIDSDHHVNCWLQKTGEWSHHVSESEVLYDSQ
ncbi:ABC transporter ATP-binding protein [Natribacillus halophilus]|uniref:Oligopeptide transport system ATP-binding protein n=1 Tax=Natribacillus halophilus TaxID=549003 RepID=A0A1G8R7X3_9BACI|nr:ABC transporter ATP-binding protein [Natribacillus halophilus]SDJ13061.1 oligopeptide transport system ATP-binding protein [Natribacillus halophilus]